MPGENLFCALSIFVPATGCRHRLLIGQPISNVIDELVGFGLTVEERGVAMPDFGVQLVTVQRPNESSQAMSVVCEIR